MEREKATVPPLIGGRDAGSIAMGTRTKDDRGNRLGAIGMLVTFMFLVVLLLQATSCVRPELIENAALNQGRMYEVIERASAASRLPVIHPLTVQLISRAEVSKLLQEDATTTTQSDAWTASQAGRSAMGLSSESPGALSTQVALLSRTTAGLYVPEDKTLYIVDEPVRSAAGGIHLDSLGSLGKEVTLAHEVIHALQHQHYPNLFEPDETLWPQQTDATLALQAAKEGDATLWAAQSVGLLGKARDPEDVIEASREAVGPLADAPALVRELTVFPYTYGYRFAYYEGTAGLASPPASTEQILHVENQGRRDFQAIDLSPFARSVEPEGCRVLYQDTMGELTLSLWLRSLDPTVTPNIWDGWDGDRWIAAECNHRREIAWLTSWDTEKDAVEFEKAIAGMAATLQSRAHLQSLMVNRQGREVVIASDAFGSKAGDLKRLAKRMRVTTHAELATHFAPAR
jgi:hypothetical protein